MSHRALGIVVSVAVAVASAQGQDRPRGTVIVSNMNDNTAMLLDAESGRNLATLPTGEGPHEVAVSRDGRWAVVSNYGVRGKPGHTVTLIDVEKLDTVRTIDLRDYQRPHGMVFLPGDTLLAVTSEVSRAVLIVDVRSGTVVGSRPSSGRGTHMLGLSSRGDRLVMGNISDGTITVLDPLAKDSGRVIRVAAQPEGVAISPDGAFAWAGSNRDSVVLVVDLRSGAPVDTLRGFGLPYRMAVSPDGRTAVVTDPVKARVRVLDAATRRQRFDIAVSADSLVATAEVSGSPSPEGVTISRDSRWAFVTLQGRNRVATIDLSRGAIIALAPTGNWSDGVAFSPLIHPNSSSGARE
jgi:DNA-binding beta-propeller fold protein YncE